MIKVESNIAETRSMFNQIMSNPEKVFDLVRFDIRQMAERVLSEIMKEELTLFLGREKYERQQIPAKNHRNGFYEKNYTVKNIGELALQIPRDRRGEFSSKIVKKYDRYEDALQKDISLMFLSGMSTRNIGLMSKSLIGRQISHGEVSKVNEELLSGIDAWRNRDLSALDIKYMLLDGVFFKMRVGHSIERIPMLVVIGVTRTNQRVFLTIQRGDKDSATTWREIFKDMKNRGLKKDLIELGIMDGLSGLMSVFCDEFPNAKVQRCQVHVARNVLCKVPQKMKQTVADKLRDIFYAESKKKSLAAFKVFYTDFQKELPSAVQCLSSVIEECLTFFNFPKEEWLSLRTTNAIERVNKEFKRRTKSMEILAGENSAYRLLCFVALKMELGWRNSPLHRKTGLPCLHKFTQLN